MPLALRDAACCHRGGECPLEELVEQVVTPAPKYKQRQWPAGR
eukprot:SAG11_NODE_36242_length_262_cov_1.564417_1_plen_42_part_10